MRGRQSLGISITSCSCEYHLPTLYLEFFTDRWHTNKLRGSDGGERYWDYPVNRYEFGIGYHPARRVLTKLVAQINRLGTTDLFDNELYALQFSVGF